MTVNFGVQNRMKTKFLKAARFKKKKTLKVPAWKTLKMDH